MSRRGGNSSGRASRDTCTQRSSRGRSAARRARRGSGRRRRPGAGAPRRTPRLIGSEKIGRKSNRRAALPASTCALNVPHHHVAGPAAQQTTPRARDRTPKPARADPTRGPAPTCGAREPPRRRWRGPTRSGAARGSSARARRWSLEALDRLVGRPDAVEEEQVQPGDEQHHERAPAPARRCGRAGCSATRTVGSAASSSSERPARHEAAIGSPCGALKISYYHDNNKIMLSQTAEYASAPSVPRPAPTARPGRARWRSARIPRNYLSKIVHALARDGVLESTRGRRAASDWRARRAAELRAGGGAIRRHRRVRHCLLGRPQCSDRTACAAHSRWKDVRSGGAFFRETTVADLEGAVSLHDPQSTRGKEPPVADNREASRRPGVPLGPAPARPAVPAARRGHRGHGRLLHRRGGSTRSCPCQPAPLP